MLFMLFAAWCVCRVASLCGRNSSRKGDFNKKLLYRFKIADHMPYVCVCVCIVSAMTVIGYFMLHFITRRLYAIFSFTRLTHCRCGRGLLLKPTESRLYSSLIPVLAAHFAIKMLYFTWETFGALRANFDSISFGAFFLSEATFVFVLYALSVKADDFVCN